VWKAVFSPDATRLATASADGFVKVWDAQTGSEVLQFKADPSSVKSVAFSPDGKLLATAGEDGTSKVWDSRTGKELQPRLSTSGPGRPETVESVAFSPDGKLLATASADNSVKVWNAATRKMKWTQSAHLDAVWMVAFSPDSKYLASVSGDKTARVWDANSGEELMTLGGHSGPVWSVAFDPKEEGNNRLATVSSDGTAQIYAWKLEDLLTLARQRVTRDLTDKECERYFQTQTCRYHDLSTIAHETSRSQSDSFEKPIR
jgi:WD40 repeat protein